MDAVVPTCCESVEERREDAHVPAFGIGGVCRCTPSNDAVAGQ